MHIDKLAWAVSLCNGAKRIVAGDPDATLHDIAAPIYLLIGFSIENALKAFIEHAKAIAPKLHRSHNLTDLLAECAKHGLALPPDITEFVQAVSPHHANFSFRYPENAGWISLFKPAFAVMQTERLLAHVTVTFDPADIQNWTPNPAHVASPRR